MEQGHDQGGQEGQAPHMDGAQMAAPMMAKKPGLLENGRLLAWMVAGFAFLLPLFVIPSTTTGSEASKTWLIELVAIVSVFLLVVRFFMKGSIVLPKHLASYGLVGILVATLISALTSESKVTSLIGNGSSVGTFSTIALLVLLAFITFQAFRDRTKLFSMNLALAGSYAVLAIYHLIRWFGGPDSLSFGVFTNPVFSPVGKWNDFAVLSGLVLILSVITFHYFKKNTGAKVASCVLALASTFFLVVIDFWMLWIVIAIVGLIFVLQTGWSTKASETGVESKRTFSPKHLSFMAVAVVIVGLLFGYFFRLPLGGSTIGQRILQGLNAQPYAEIVLPPSPTLGIAKSVWHDHMLVGIGANRFSNAYFLNKPDGINSTALWDSSFDSGFSHLTTFFVTTGLLGTLAWLFLTIVILYAILQALRKSTDSISSYLGQSIGLGLLYLWITLIVYLPNLTIVALTFVFAGALLAFLSASGAVKTAEFRMPSSKGLGVAVVPLLVLIAIGVAYWGYVLTNVLRAESHYQQGRILANQGDTRGAITEAKAAALLAPRDSYYRLLTDLQLLELQRVLSEAPASQDELRSKVTELTGGAAVSADAAVALDPSDYLNYVSKASIADLLATIGVSRNDTGNAAKTAYLDALRVNPSSPRLYFALGRIELLLGDKPGAMLNLEKASTLRPAYPEAIAALAELNRQDGNIDKAIETATRGLQSDPNNFVIAYQLGVLYYSNKDYDRAISALESAVTINPYYADAKYFLGISYARKGDKEKALKAFEDVRQLNPQNAEILRVIRNLNQGRDPLLDQ